MNEIDAARIYKVLQKKLELPYSHKRATVFYFFLYENRTKYNRLKQKYLKNF